MCSTFMCSIFMCSIFMCSIFMCSTVLCSTVACSIFICSSLIYSTFISSKLFTGTYICSAFFCSTVVSSTAVECCVVDCSLQVGTDLIPHPGPAQTDQFHADSQRRGKTGYFPGEMRGESEKTGEDVKTAGEYMNRCLLWRSRSREPRNALFR